MGDPTFGSAISGRFPSGMDALSDGFLSLFLGMVVLVFAQTKKLIRQTPVWVFPPLIPSDSGASWRAAAGSPSPNRDPQCDARCFLRHVNDCIDGLHDLSTRAEVRARTILGAEKSDMIAPNSGFGRIGLTILLNVVSSNIDVEVYEKSGHGLGRRQPPPEDRRPRRQERAGETPVEQRRPGQARQHHAGQLRRSDQRRHLAARDGPRLRRHRRTGPETSRTSATAHLVDFPVPGQGPDKGASIPLDTFVPVPVGELFAGRSPRSGRRYRGVCHPARYTDRERRFTARSGLVARPGGVRCGGADSREFCRQQPTIRDPARRRRFLADKRLSGPRSAPFFPARDELASPAAAPPSPGTRLPA